MTSSLRLPSWTIAVYLDRLIELQDTIDEIVEKAAAEVRKRGHRTTYTAGKIHQHIKFRIQHGREELKEETAANMAI